MTDTFKVENAAIAVHGEGQVTPGALNRAGAQVVVDFITHLYLAGYVYHVQAGTEDAPATATASIDDQLAFILMDQNAGYAAIPLAAQVKIANWSTSTLFNSMVEVDMAKNRYASGGTAFTPRNLRGDTPYSWNGAAYVAGASDIVAAAKSAVPDSVELWRGTVVEDAQATPDAAAANTELAFSARNHPLACAIDAAAIILHCGAATADPSVYALLQAAQFSKTLVV